MSFRSRGVAAIVSERAAGQRVTRVRLEIGALSAVVPYVGNLVCLALFDLGERAKVVMFSVTEGEDNPLKYPHTLPTSILKTSRTVGCKSGQAMGFLLRTVHLCDTPYVDDFRRETLRA